eukprot:136694-Chlamydomonas_euryale.AAC.3
MYVIPLPPSSFLNSPTPGRPWSLQEPRQQLTACPHLPVPQALIKSTSTMACSLERHPSPTPPLWPDLNPVDD